MAASKANSNAKLFIPSNIDTQMNILLFLFWGRLDHQGSTENFCNFAKVSYFYHIFMEKTNIKLEFLYIVVLT